MYISSCVGFLNCAVAVRNFIMASLKRKILRLEERMDVLKKLDNGQSCRSVWLREATDQTSLSRYWNDLKASAGCGTIHSCPH